MTSASPLENVDAVKAYLKRSEGWLLNQVEVAGLVSTLQGGVDSAEVRVFVHLALGRNSSNRFYF